MRMTAAVVVAGCLITVGASGASAGVAADASAALERLSATGQLSSADRATLLKYPKLAAQVMDPAATTVEVTQTVDAAKAAEVGAQGCWILQHHHHAKTLLGFTFYKFHHRADYCENGSVVQGVHFRSHWNSEVASSAKWIGIENDWVTPTPSWEVKSFKKGQFDNCLPTGICISSTHPWVELTMRGNASYSIANGEN